jgi:hypothetical protein
LWKQPGIGRVSLALIQAIQQPRIGLSVGLSALLSSKPEKASGLRAQASFQLFCCHPVVKTIWDKSSTFGSHPGHENNPG